MDISVIARLDALVRLRESLTKQQVEDLQIVIKNTERVVTWDRFGDDSICMEDAGSTLAGLARDLNFSPDDDETVEY
jgi:hypothetical protein